MLNNVSILVSFYDSLSCVILLTILTMILITFIIDILALSLLKEYMFCNSDIVPYNWFIVDILFVALTFLFYVEMLLFGIVANKFLRLLLSFINLLWLIIGSVIVWKDCTELSMILDFTFKMRIIFGYLLLFVIITSEYLFFFFDFN